MLNNLTVVVVGLLTVALVSVLYFAIPIMVVLSIINAVLAVLGQ